MLEDKYHLLVAPSQFMYIWNLKLEEGFGANFFFAISRPRHDLGAGAILSKDICLGRLAFLGHTLSCEIETARVFMSSS